MRVLEVKAKSPLGISGKNRVVPSLISLTFGYRGLEKN
jgi:hypothetical protein